MPCRQEFRTELHWERQRQPCIPSDRQVGLGCALGETSLPRPLCASIFVLVERLSWIRWIPTMFPVRQRHEVVTVIDSVICIADGVAIDHCPAHQATKCWGLESERLRHVD
jgi:hypothetical protein